MTDINYESLDEHTLLVLMCKKQDELNGKVFRHEQEIIEMKTTQDRNCENIKSIWENIDTGFRFTFKQLVIIITIIAVIAVGGSIGISGLLESVV